MDSSWWEIAYSIEGKTVLPNDRDISIADALTNIQFMTSLQLL